MTPETALKHQIKDWLNLKRVFWWYNLAGIGAKRGLPDLFALKDGILYGIEAKAPKGRQSANQEEFEKEFTNAGGKYILAKTLEDIIHFLN